MSMVTKEKTEKKKIDKALTLADLKRNIEKEIGAGSVMLGKGSIVKVDVFPTGVAALDVALGCGGLPQGRIIEFYGPESSGKTTTCLQLIAACQQHFFAKKGRQGVTAFIDAEHAFDIEWAEKVGVDVDNLLLSQPDSGEEAFTIAERMIDSGLIDLIVIDSVAALIPQKILDGEIGDSTIGAQAQLMSKGMNRLKGKCNNTKTTIIFINQIREKIGVMFGNNETTPGGRALKFYASVRIEIRKGPPIKDKDVVIGFRPSVKIVKNKVARPFLTGNYDICVGAPQRPVYGIDKEASLLEVAAGYKIITQSGNFYSYENRRLGNGFGNSANALRDDKETIEAIRKKIYNEITNHTTISPVDESESDDSFDESETDDELEDDE